MPGRDIAAQHRLRTLVQAPQQGAEGGGDDEGHEHGAHAGALARCLEGAFGALVEALRLARFLHIALHHRDLAEHLCGDRAGVGHAVLAGAAQLAHAPAEEQARQHHQHQDAQHLRHHHRVGDDQHEQRTGAHHGVAQPHAERRADDGLHQRGVGGQAAEDLAGLRGLEELGALPHHVGVDGVAQVGRDALAQPGDHVKAQGGEQAQRRAHGEQGTEVLAQRHDALARISRHQPLVDQRLQGHGQQQGAGGGHDQEHHRPSNAPSVGPQEGDQAAERLG